MAFVEIDGNLWPEGDTKCRSAAISQLPTLTTAIKHCRNRRIAVQAGGNCGIWPRELAQHFEFVYTFEPEPNNFRCLVHNTEKQTNIIKLQAAIGYRAGLVGLNYRADNIGAHNVIEPELAQRTGVMPVIALDEMCLPCLDFLQLDVEGYEHRALMGARNMIRQHKPVIMIEHKKHCEKYGVSQQEILNFFSGLGYSEGRKIERDLLFIHEG